MAREKYRAQLETKRRQDALVNSLFDTAESQGDITTRRFVSLRDEDERENEKRDWLERVKEQAMAAEVAKQEEEEARRLALEAAANEPKKEKTKLVGGYFVWQRNEHLTLKRGKLPSPWRKKKDEATGRWYFKNTVTKTTTWVDPRTYETRKHDPLETVDDELPFGWDEAETAEGVHFYINHLDNTHHRDHPRIELEKKQRSYAKKQAESEEAAQQK